jgi:hypothetical protein
MTKHQLIKSILLNYPETRDSDKRLMLRVWEAQGGGFSERQIDFLTHKAISPDTISRIRRRLRQTGVVCGTEAIESERFHKFTQIRGNSSLENISSVL